MESDSNILEVILNYLGYNSEFQHFKRETGNKLKGDDLLKGFILKNIIQTKDNVAEARTNLDLINDHTSELVRQGSIYSYVWVKLNVGGQIFITTRDTLTKEKGSMLTTMFAKDLDMKPGEKDGSGAYLIDRDPKYFSVILNYLRHGTLIIDMGLRKEGVLKEAEYFGIQTIIPQLNIIEDDLEERVHKMTLEKLGKEKIFFENEERRKEQEVKQKKRDSTLSTNRQTEFYEEIRTQFEDFTNEMKGKLEGLVRFMKNK